MASIQLRLDQDRANLANAAEQAPIAANGFNNDNNNSNSRLCPSASTPDSSSSQHARAGPSRERMAVDEAPMKRLKKMGWYWGSISPDYATKLLENEQDGSFLVRDSSSECYIFSMTFKLDGQVHHARIEHSKGHFSFGRSPKFFCTTIVDFIEQAIEFSHNGDLLFFLHRDPSMEGPVRFRMIPFSRLCQSSLKGSMMTSLKHMSRFAILPYVRRDRICELTIPECLREYLYEPFLNSNHHVTT